MKNKTLIKLILGAMQVFQAYLVVFAIFFAITAMWIPFSSKMQNTQITNTMQLLPKIDFYSDYFYNGRGLDSGIYTEKGREKIRIESINVQFDSLIPPKGISLFIMLSRILLLIFGIYAFNKLIRVISSVLENQLFTKENSILLGKSAKALVIGAVFDITFLILINIYLKNKIFIAGFKMNYILDSIDVYAIVAAVIVLFIAEIFRIGTELKEESELTI